MEYEQNGKRKFFSLEIIEANSERYRSLGAWDPVREVRHYRNVSEIQKESSLSIANKTLRVVSKIVSKNIRRSRYLDLPPAPLRYTCTIVRR